MPFPRQYANATERQRAHREKIAIRLREIGGLEMRVLELEARIQELEGSAVSPPASSAEGSDNAAPAFPVEPGRQRWQAILDCAQPMFATIYDEMNAASRTQQEHMDFYNGLEKRNNNKPETLQEYITEFEWCKSIVERGKNAKCRFPLRPGEEVPKDWDERRGAKGLGRLKRD